jgi:aspartokinase-like uncharacterized kinase
VRRRPITTADDPRDSAMSIARSDFDYRCTVLKLGGSLLELPDLASRLRRLLAEIKRPVLFVGGGAAADLVRDWDARFGLGETAAHELAMESLSLTAELVRRVLGDARLCTDTTAIAAAWSVGECPIILPRPWFEQSPGWFAGTPRLAGGLLPQSWAVTSDTLAAAMAVDLHATALVLLKSTAAQRGSGLEDLAAQGLIDPYCPAVARLLSRVEWVNLRAESHPVRMSIGDEVAIDSV